MSRDDDAQVELVARECLANKVRLLNRAVTAVYDEALRPFALTIGQMSMLVTVAREERASPAGLGRLLHMEKSTLSRNVDRMRVRGWLTVAPTDDGRTTELRVTPSGRGLLRRVHPAWSKAQRRAAAMLGAHGVRGIIRAVAMVAERRERA